MIKSVLFSRKHTHVPLCHSIDNTMSGGKSRTRDSGRLYSLRQRNATIVRHDSKCQTYSDWICCSHARCVCARVCVCECVCVCVFARMCACRRARAGCVLASMCVELNAMKINIINNNTCFGLLTIV